MTGQVGPSGKMSGQYNGVIAVPHTSDSTLWIFAVHAGDYTKMVGVTIVNGVETGSRSARYVLGHHSLTSASVSSLWNSGSYQAYSCGAGYCLHSISIVSSVSTVCVQSSLMYRLRAYLLSCVVYVQPEILVHSRATSNSAPCS